MFKYSPLALALLASLAQADASLDKIQARHNPAPSDPL